MRLVLCDANRIFCEALALVLEARSHQALAIALTPDAGVAAVATHQPDACLMDLHFPNGGDGLHAVRAIRASVPGDGSPRHVRPQRPGGLIGRHAARRYGLPQQRSGTRPGSRSAGHDRCRPDGGHSRVVAQVGLGTRPTARYGPALKSTPRETEVLRRIAAGQDTKTMVREMNVTTGTLRTYVKNVLAKLGAHSRLEAAALASLGVPSGHNEPDRDHPWLAALTPREREVLLCLMKGFGLREVAKHLHMSSRTVHTHLQNLRSKLGVHSTLEAVTLARSRLDERPKVGAGAM